MSYFDEQVFTGMDFGAEKWQKGEYVDCRFENCRMSGLDLTGDSFSTCEFVGCDLSLSKLGGASFKEVRFLDCKLMGLHFGDCSPFLIEFSFRNCTLDFSSFFRLKIKSTRFEKCKMEKVDFTQTDLTGSIFLDCDMNQTVFDKAILDKCDLREVHQFGLDPDNNSLKGARFSVNSALGLLSKYNIRIEA